MGELMLGANFREEVEEPTLSAVGCTISKLWSRGERLGSGKFGTVFRCMDHISGALFAVKDIALGNNTKRDRLFTLMREVDVMSQLNHPNILRYYGADVQGDTLSIFLEYVSGGTLEKRVSEFGPLCESVVKVYTRHLLEGLLYLHSKGFIHHDIKPANILVDVSGNLKLADFGCSEMLSELSVQSREILGTPAYMAPEIVQRRENTCAGDIWSLGCTIIEIATGKGPWPAGFQVETVLYHLRKGKSPAISETLPPTLKDFISRCLVSDCKERATSAQLLCHSFVSLASPLQFVSGVSPCESGKKRKELEELSPRSEDSLSCETTPRMVPPFVLMFSCGHFMPLTQDGMTPEEAALVGHSHPDGTEKGKLTCYGPFDSCANYAREMPSCVSSTAVIPVRNLFTSSFQSLSDSLSQYALADPMTKRRREYPVSPIPSPDTGSPSSVSSAVTTLHHRYNHRDTEVSTRLANIGNNVLMEAWLAMTNPKYTTPDTPPSSPMMSPLPSPRSLSSVAFPSLVEPVNHEWFRPIPNSSGASSVQILAERALAGTRRTMSLSTPSYFTRHPVGPGRTLFDLIVNPFISWTKEGCPGAASALFIFGAFSLWHNRDCNWTPAAAASSSSSYSNGPAVIYLPSPKPKRQTRPKFESFIPRRCLFLLARRKLGM